MRSMTQEAREGKLAYTVNPGQPHGCRNRWTLRTHGSRRTVLNLRKRSSTSGGKSQTTGCGTSGNEGNDESKGLRRTER